MVEVVRPRLKGLFVIFEHKFHRPIQKPGGEQNFIDVIHRARREGFGFHFGVAEAGHQYHRRLSRPATRTPDQRGACFVPQVLIDKRDIEAAGFQMITGVFPVGDMN